MKKEIAKEPPRSWREKFADTFRGMGAAVRGEKSFTVHFFFAIAVIAAGAALRVSRLEWALLVMCITGVLTAELLNSALERLAKAIDQRNAHLGAALDIGSAAVLVAAIGSVVVGLLVFVFRLGAALQWWEVSGLTLSD